MNSDTAMILSTLARPKSRGRIQLRSADPYDHPIIDPRYYSHPDDAKVMLQALKFAQQVVETPSMQKLSMSLHSTPYSPCDDHQIHSDSYLECLIDHSSFTLYHPVGTCKMGREDDPEAVVDPQLK